MTVETVTFLNAVTVQNFWFCAKVVDCGSAITAPLFKDQKKFY